MSRLQVGGLALLLGDSHEYGTEGASQPELIAIFSPALCGKLSGGDW